VSLYRVTNTPDGSLVGWFYLDLHPREGKYSHAAVFPLISGCAAGDVGLASNEEAARIIPVAACVCNFTKPTADRPSLLQHSEVETLFHEYGHVMHHLCSKTRLHRHASFRCEGDFVEAPSQMLENWVWQPSMLALLSGHHSDASRKLPADMAAKLAASQLAHAGIFNMRQCFLAMFDQTLHTIPAAAPPSGGDAAALPPPPSTAALLERLHTEVLGIPMSE